MSSPRPVRIPPEVPFIAHPAWLAGLLEGEGSFGQDGASIVVEVKMTDRDVIARAALAFGGVNVYAVPQSPLELERGHKPCFRARARGTRALDIMLRVYPYLGERRAARVAGLVTGFLASRVALPDAGAPISSTDTPTTKERAA